MEQAASCVKIALDGNGGDAGCPATAAAVRQVLATQRNVALSVYGAPQMAGLLHVAPALRARLRFVAAPQNIPQDASVRAVLHNYRASSMYQALDALRRREVQAVVSCGGTGPLVVLSRHLLGSWGLRPALCARLPAGPRTSTLMLDLGANAAACSRDLLDFARLGSAAASLLLDVRRPRLALLNVGSEEHKGSLLIREARDLIAAQSLLNYIGFIEACDLFTGQTEVIVTDGFCGNIALKTAEGVVALYTHGGLHKLCGRLATPRWLMPWRYNGSLLLGVGGIVVKSHASASAAAITTAVGAAAAFAAADFCTRLLQALPEAAC